MSPNHICTDFFLSSVAATLVADLVQSGIQIVRGAQVADFDIPISDKAPIRLKLQAKGGHPLSDGRASEIRCDAYLAAVGRKPNTDNLNIEAAGIAVDEYGGILVNSRLCTTAPGGNVFAAGDVVGRPFLASTGVAQSMAAIKAMFADSTKGFNSEEGGAKGVINFDPISLAANPLAFPVGIWSSPEAAYYGLSLQQAQGSGIDAAEAIALYAECLRGRVFSPNGLLKLVFEKPAGRILGVHICGEDSCEMVHYGMEVVKAGRTIMDLNNSMYSAVTFHELYRIAAQAALDEGGARKRRAAAGKALAQRNRLIRDKEKA